MKSLRKYGKAPHCVALIHGGPGAPGEMAPVARELSTKWGILEPIQTAHTIRGQVEELRAVLEKNNVLPVMLVGYSWGAWLGLIVAARYPSLVQKLILISSGPFEEKYALDIMKVRLHRLGREERREVLSLIESFNDSNSRDLNGKMSRFGQLISKSDSFDPISQEGEALETQYEIFHNVWKEAEALRSNGELLRFARQIKCPVTAIHGDYDPHPAKGVEEPLSKILQDFRFILINDCGHTPWIEKHAEHEFFRILRRELET